MESRRNGPRLSSRHDDDDDDLDCSHLGMIVVCDCVCVGIVTLGRAKVTIGRLGSRLRVVPWAWLRRDLS